MIRWVNIRLNEWADWSMRVGIKLGYPSRSVEGRIMEEGFNAGARGTPSAPIVDMPDDVEATDEAVKSLPPHLRNLIQERYLKGGTDADCAKRLKISHGTFRTRLDMAHHWMAGRMEDNAA